MKHNHSLNFTTFSNDGISLSINDRGLFYGDGFFETMLFNNNTIRFWDYHWERIQKGIAVFGFQQDYLKETDLLLEIKKLAHTNNLPYSIVKINFWRTEGGLFTPSSKAFNILIQQKNITPKTESSIRVGISKNVTNYFSPISEIKTMSAAKYVLAGLEIKQSEFDDMLILDKNGFVSELTSSNIFIIKEGILYTPPLSTGCVSGVLRKAICTTFSVQEKNLCFDEIQQQDTSFSTNAAGIKVINRIMNKKLNTVHPILFEINEWLKQQLHP